MRPIYTGKILGSIRGRSRIIDIELNRCSMKLLRVVMLLTWLQAAKPRSLSRGLTSQILGFGPAWAWARGDRSLSQGLKPWLGGGKMTARLSVKM
jgi:hypothetical protein